MFIFTLLGKLKLVIGLQSFFPRFNLLFQHTLTRFISLIHFSCFTNIFRHTFQDLTLCRCLLNDLIFSIFCIQFLRWWCSCLRCNTIIYSCLCGSLLESEQEGKGEIRYQFRQCSVCLQGYGKLVTIYFFKVFECQVGMSARFDPPTHGLGF